MSFTVPYVTDRPRYDVTSIKVVTLREAVQARPHMYFGDRPPQEWPLIILTWTIVDLFDDSDDMDQHVDASLDDTGTVTVIRRRACIRWRPSARATDPVAALRNRMWWLELTRDTNIQLAETTQEGCSCCAALPHGHLAIHGHVQVRAAVDPLVIPANPSTWWANWQQQLPAAITAVSYQLAATQRIRTTDNRTHRSITLEHKGNRPKGDYDGDRGQVPPGL